MNALSIALPDATVDTIVNLVAERLRAFQPDAPPVSPYMTTQQAADYLCCTRQRIHDLLTAGSLSRFKEGRRTLVLRAELEDLVQLDRRRRGR